MVQNISVDTSTAEVVASAYNKNARAHDTFSVSPGEVPATCYVKLTDTLPDAEREALAAAIVALSPKISHVELQAEAVVPDALDGHNWVFHIDSHLRADKAAAEPEA